MGLRGKGARPAGVVEAAEGLPPRKEWKTRARNDAERVARFLERHVMVTAGPQAGTWFRLRPWQRRIVEGIYATGPDGRRRCRRAVISVARGNGKTGLAVGIALAHLVGPVSEPRGSIVCAARTRDQAAIMFHEAEAAILANPELAALVNVRRHHKDIEVLAGPAKGSRLTVISADAKSAHGLNPSLVIMDELAQARDRDLYDALLTAMGKRADPLLVVISTQASSDGHIMSELVDCALAVERGDAEDEGLRGFIWSAPAGCDVQDEAAWRAANPGLGDLVSLRHMREMAAEAARLPSAEAAFRALHLNQRVNATERFVSRAAWDACRVDDLDPSALYGKRCVGGLDLSATRDLTALVLVFDVGGRIVVLPRFWLPSRMADGLDYRGVPIRAWAEAGHLELIPGAATIDPAVVAERVAALAEDFDLAHLAFDRWRAEDFKRELDKLGCRVPLVPHGQGFRDMAPAVDALERAVLDGSLAHPANPVLTWNIANLALERDAAGNRKPSKARAVERVDGAVALMMALAMRRADEPAPTPYALTHGPLVLG